MVWAWKVAIYKGKEAHYGTHGRQTKFYKCLKGVLNDKLPNLPDLSKAIMRYMDYINIVFCEEAFCIIVDLCIAYQTRKFSYEIVSTR